MEREAVHVSVLLLIAIIETRSIRYRATALGKEGSCEYIEMSFLLKVLDE